MRDSGWLLPTLTLSLLALACAQQPGPKLTTIQYQSFPRTARVPKVCVIHTRGMDTFRQASQGQVFAFDPSEKLASALLEGLKRTCQRTVIDSRAGDVAELDFHRELGVVGEVTNVSLRQGFDIGGHDEVWIDARIQVFDSVDSEPLSIVQQGHSAQLSSFDDVQGSIAMAFVEVIDAVNQRIFDHRGRLSTVGPRNVGGPD